MNMLNVTDVNFMSFYCVSFTTIKTNKNKSHMWPVLQSYFEYFFKEKR